MNFSDNKLVIKKSLWSNNSATTNLFHHKHKQQLRASGTSVIYNS